MPEKPDPRTDAQLRGLGGRVAGFTVLGLGLLVAAVWTGVYLTVGNDLPRNARVEGIRIGGLSPQQAQTRLQERLSVRVEKPIRLTYGDGRDRTVDPTEAGLAVDYSASVEEAGGGWLLGPRRVWVVLTGGGDRQAEVSIDQSRMQPTLDDLGEGIEAATVEGDIDFRDGRAEPVVARTGRAVDRSAAQAALERRFLHGGSQKIPTVSRRPKVDDEAVRRSMDQFAKPAMSGPVTLVLDGQEVDAPPELFGEGLSMTEKDGELVPRVDGKAIIKALAPVLRATGRAPRDARIVVRQGKPRVLPAKPGLELDPEELEEGFAEVATRAGAERRLEIEGRPARPAFSTAEAKELKVVERISTFTTNFPYAEYRNVNLSRAAKLVNGTVLKPGETFSLNRIVGERTKDNGFTEGYVVADGIFKKDLGGGVSQIATTTFNAMFFAGLKDVEHKPHSVYIDRYPEGREATVAWPSLDLKFTNDTPYGVLVSARVRKAAPGGEGAATVSMYSTKRWKITSRTGPRTSFRSPQVRYLQSSDCEAASGTTGFSVDVFRYFRDLDSGKVKRKERFRTDYIAGDTVRCGALPQAEPAPQPKPDSQPKPDAKPNKKQQPQPKPEQKPKPGQKPGGQN